MEKQSNNSLGNVLRIVRIAQDLSTRDIADKMNVRTSYITDVERGDRTPGVDTLAKYCNALNIDRSFVFTCVDEQEKQNYPYRKLLMGILQKIDALDNEHQKAKTDLENLNNMGVHS